MSTRCQLQVIEDKKNGGSKVTLYRHDDGYPQNILEKLYQAYCHGNKNNISDKTLPGKVASLICWTDPTEFEPESGHKLHCDIQFYYRLFCRYSFSEMKVIWEIEIFGIDWPCDFDMRWTESTKWEQQKENAKNFRLDPRVEKLTLIQERQRIENLLNFIH